MGSLGLNLIVSVIIGVFIGLGLGKIFGSVYLFIIIFAILGFAAGIYEIYRAVKMQLEKDSQP